MCRGKNECSQLGSDPTKWDRECPLRPPEWVNEQISIFVRAVEEFIKGNTMECLNIISTIRSEEITSWFIEHGQMSGRHRKNGLAIPKPELIAKDLRDSVRAPKIFQNAVFERDGYRCRYCGNRLISQEFMKLFIKKLDSDEFTKGTTNITTHGIIHATWPVADHVVPWNIGGRTNMDNLVASCGACNYGKDGNTCEQMGIEDPFMRPPIDGNWDGLTYKTEDVKKSYNKSTQPKSGAAGF